MTIIEQRVGYAIADNLPSIAKSLARIVEILEQAKNVDDANAKGKESK